MRFQNKVYFDCQATLPMNEKMVQAMTNYMRDSIGNPHSTDHFFGWESAKLLNEATLSIANLIGAYAEDIIFTSGATEANNLALFGLADYGASIGKQRVLVSPIEHKCVLESARFLEEHYKFTIDYLSVGTDGKIDLEDLQSKIDDDVLVVSVMAVNNEIGTVQNLQSIAEIVRSKDSLLHTDAAQAPITMELGKLCDSADLVSLSSHKIGGPVGIGALYIRHDLHGNFHPIIHGGGQQSGVRSGTVPIPLCRGFAFAAEQLMNSDIQTARKNLHRLTRHFINRLCGISDSIVLNGPSLMDRHIGNLNVRFEGYNAKELILKWQPKFAASTGSACSSGIEEESYVLRAIGLSKEQAQASIRFSLGFETELADVEDAVEIISNSL